MPRHQWQNYHRILTALALMDTHTICQLQLTELCLLINRFQIIPKTGSDTALIHFLNETDVPVKNALVIIILGLHHLIPQTEAADTADKFRLVGGRRIQSRLKSFI